MGESWLKDGHKLVLENGKPLLQGEIMIRYYVKSSTNNRQEMQLTIDKMCTVREVRLVLDRKVLVSVISLRTVEPRITITSLLQPLFSSRRNAKTFSYNKSPLLRPPLQYDQRPQLKLLYNVYPVNTATQTSNVHLFTVNIVCTDWGVNLYLFFRMLNKEQLFRRAGVIYLLSCLSF